MPLPLVAVEAPAVPAVFAEPALLAGLLAPALPALVVPVVAAFPAAPPPAVPLPALFPAAPALLDGPVV